MAKFTRTHYETIANAIKIQRLGGSILAPEQKTKEAAYQKALDVVAKMLAGEFSEDNERFDEKRFLLACGIKGAK